MSVAISIDNVIKRFGKDTIINGLSLDVRPGEFFTLLGPSGCGKTTLLRMIIGFNTIEGGEIKIDGKVINDIPTNKRNMGMVFQNYAIFPHMSVRDNVAFGLKNRKIPQDQIEAQVDDILKVVKIDHLKKRMPTRLSGGQQQRVALARAIVIHPEVLLMDEPLSNLDAKLRVEMRNAIKRIQQQVGITTIYVTHDQVEAMTLGTRIVVMKEGAIQQVAPPAELYQNPVNRFVAGFIGSPAMNFLEGKVVLSNQGPCLKGNGWQLPLTLAQGKKLMDKGYMDKMVTLGIRAEDFHEQQWGEAWLEVLADVREMLGAEVLLHGRVCGDGGAARHGTAQGEPVRDSLNWENSPHICAKLPPSCCVKAGGRVRLYVDMGRIKLFDTITEENILYV